VLDEKNPVARLKESEQFVDGLSFNFDRNNVLQNLEQEIWVIKSGKLIPYSPERMR
jgi:hypothetical protein